jgi:dynein assembly factor 3
MARLQGAGSIRFWGFTPPLDLGDAVSGVADASSPLCALLVGPGDTRHLLATLAATAQRSSAAAAAGTPAPALVEISVYEDRPEGLARQLILLAIALDFELPRRERAEVYLEVLANTLVREKTSAYIASRATVLRRMLAHGEGPLAEHIDVSLLKMKDRDALEEVLQLYAEDVPFDAVRYRDERLRRYYDARYDARKNVLDWDYTMELKPIAPIVHKLHFREWRMTGLAFEVRNAAYVAPNRTLSSMAFGRELGMSKMRRGYWGDVVSKSLVLVGQGASALPRPTG